MTAKGDKADVRPYTNVCLKKILRLIVRLLQGLFCKLVTKRWRRSKKGSFKVQAGFYTEQQMKDDLNLSPPETYVVSKLLSSNLQVMLL